MSSSEEVDRPDAESDETEEAGAAEEGGLFLGRGELFLCNIEEVEITRDNIVLGALSQHIENAVALLLSEYDCWDAYSVWSGTLDRGCVAFHCNGDSRVVAFDAERLIALDCELGDWEDIVSEELPEELLPLYEQAKERVAEAQSGSYNGAIGYLYIDGEQNVVQENAGKLSCYASISAFKQDFVGLLAMRASAGPTELTAAEVELLASAEEACRSKGWDVDRRLTTMRECLMQVGIRWPTSSV